MLYERTMTNQPAIILSSLDYDRIDALSLFAPVGAALISLSVRHSN